MRKLTIASLFLVVGSSSLAFACNGTSDDTADDDAATGGLGGGSNASGGSGTGTGGGGNTLPEGCLSVVKATGTPTMVADFNNDDPAIMLENDGRLGEFVHGTFLSKAGGVAFLEFPNEDEGMGGGPSYLHFRCQEGNEDDPQCNTPWDSTPPKNWEQYASIETPLQTYSPDGINCYDVEGVYDAMTFKAKGITGANKIRVQILTPKTNPDTGESFQSAEITLTNEWATYTVAFADVKQPTWSTVTPKTLDLRTLGGISFVVRNTEAQSDETTTPATPGETLLPYDIGLDDIQFIKQ